jgi:hypothetical protein
LKSGTNCRDGSPLADEAVVSDEPPIAVVFAPVADVALILGFDSEAGIEMDEPED